MKSGTRILIEEAEQLCCIMSFYLRKISIFIILGVVLNLVGGYILRTDKRVLTKKKLYFQDLRMQEFYAQEENVDILFIGSSRTYQTFIPGIVDSITGKNSFNLGSSMQTPITSYFVLKEAYKYCQPEMIIMDIALDVMYSDQLFNGGFIIDAMKMSLNKIDFFFKGFDFKEKMELLLPIYRYRGDIDFFYFWLKGNLSEHYDRKLKYHEKGFVENYIENNEEKEQEYIIDDKFLHNKEYLDKIVELGGQNETEIIFVYIPYPTYHSIKNEDELSSYLYEIIVEDYEKEFLNYLEIDHDYDDEFFADYNHFNLEGAIKFSKEIAEWIVVRGEW